MKFICKSPYREYRGRVFAYGRAVDIDDQATIDAMHRDDDFIALEDDFSKGGDPDGEERQGEGQEGLLVVQQAAPRLGPALVAQPMQFSAPVRRSGWPKGKKRK